MIRGGGKGQETCPEITRRTFLESAGRYAAGSLLLPAVAGCAPPRSGPPSGRPPNLVVVLADDLGIERLGCYGGPAGATPHLDRLASKGIQFRHCYSSPVCTPSRVQ
ncbi:MAG: sulfatase-like hydrolase/transferase, partial [Verrucomicrobiota bacterium]|nr:sulfatase-like hydrolase/transferase [Verrucomicrobiota bacterium]